MLDNYLRERAAGNGAKGYNGLFLRKEQKEGEEGPFTIQFSNYEEGGKARAQRCSPDMLRDLQRYTSILAAAETARSAAVSIFWL